MQQYLKSNKLSLKLLEINFIWLNNSMKKAGKINKGR
jgi:hypothetical protein